MRITRARALLVAAAIVLTVLQPSAVAARERARLGEATVSPSSSPSPGARSGDRSRSPAFVILLVLLGLGLLWQYQRARRTTADVSSRSLDDLERTLHPDERRDAPPPD